MTKPSLLSEIEALQKQVRGSPTCLCCLVLREADPAVAEALKTALDTPHINGATIGRWLRTKGIRCSDYSIRRHRRGECQ